MNVMNNKLEHVIKKRFLFYMFYNQFINHFIGNFSA